ncbi:MAG: beta-lactamase domain protein [Gemmatimonadetes bacterium]|nr:beta-lactamase domain protein [Gemmatimonadota bacterium]
MIIDHVTVGAFQENCYLVSDPGTGGAVLVDPGAEPEAILEMVERAGVTLEAIWLTHAHIDHIGGIAGVKAKWNVPVLMHHADQPIYARGAEVSAMYGLPFDQPPAVDREIVDGEELTLGRFTFTVMHVPGHSPGHVLFIGEGNVLGGDLLFAGSIGRTDMPYCDPVAMERSLERAMTLDDSLVVHPGHGPSTTIGDERASNPFLNGTARPVKR